jgi:multisubunit Na+/H+ antiporter MnhF subunit
MILQATIAIAIIIIIIIIIIEPELQNRLVGIATILSAG